MTSMWHNLTATATAFAPGVPLRGRGQPARANTETPRPMPAIMEAGLCLALDDAPAGHVPDFLFERNPALGGLTTLWHPDPRSLGRLDQTVLQTLIEAMAAGEIGDPQTASLLRDALSGLSNIRNLEICWTDDDSATRCWQMSTMHIAGPDGQATVAGMVRDMTAAQDTCEEISIRLSSAAAQDACATMATASIADVVREQAMLITGICDLLAEPVEQVADDQHCKRHDFVTDVRQAVSQIILNAELLKDYTHARSGTLQLHVQRWSAAELIRALAPLLRDLMAPNHCQLQVQPLDIMASLACDPYKLVRFLMVEMAPACLAMAPHSMARLTADAGQQGDLTFMLDCPVRTAGHAQEQDSANTSSQTTVLHPALSKPFRTRMLQAHAGKVEVASGTGNRIRVIVRLTDCKDG